MSQQERYSNVIDCPLEPGGKDSLGVAPHVKSLVEFIRLAQMPTTMAIQGEWGSGKTSLMNQVSHQLCEMSDNQNCDDEEKLYYGIWLNTWQYSLMKSQEETLVSIIKKITDEVIGIMNRRHPESKKNFEEVRHLAKKVFKVGAKVALGFAGGNPSALNDEHNEKDSPDVNPLIFRKALSDAIEHCLKLDKTKDSKRRGFIFFIDDLDRLDPPVAVQILEVLKNLFEVNHCIFVLAIDYDVVVKGLEPKFGKLTEKNEREFRSFFDKIIQLPFNMPVGRYEIDTYLTQTLEAIGYFTKGEMGQKLKIDNIEEIDQKLSVADVKDKKNDRNRQEKLAVILVEMIRLSTGFNPRAIKRLINTLSLILIMHNNKLAVISDDEEDLQLTVNDKLLAFGLVCVQISYPIIYNFLEIEPNIKGWDEKTATKHSLPKLDDEIIFKLEIMTEFDEGWEQVLYRKCIKDSYLEPRAASVSSLLNIIWDNISGDADKKINAITKILGVASVTTVNTSETIISTNENQRKNIRFDSIEDFFSNYKMDVEGGKVPNNIVKIANEIYKNLTNEYSDSIRVSFLKDAISFYIRSSKRKFFSMQPYYDQDGWFILWDIEGREGFINTLTPDKANSLTESLYRIIKRSFNRLK